MKFLVVLPLFVSIIYAGVVEDVGEKVKCAEGKRFMAQGPNCETTCADLLDPITRQANLNNFMCKIKRPGCFCPEDKNVLDKKSNKCISRDDCCPEGRKYSVEPACQTTCDDINSPNYSATNTCNDKKQGCFCAQNLILNTKTDKCVSKSDCCLNGKVYFDEKTGAESCDDLFNFDAKKANTKRSGCFCPATMVWSNKLNKCVDKNDCCSQGKQFFEQRAADESCEELINPVDPNKVSAAKTTSSGCFCPLGQAFSNKLNKCVTKDECCSGFEGKSFFEQKAGGEDICEDVAKATDVNKVNAARKNTVSGCFCSEGTAWSNKENKCVAMSQCCSGGKVIREQTGCEMTCEQLINPAVHVGNLVNAACKTTQKGCFCPEGNVWSQKESKCMTKSECLKSKFNIFG